MTRSLDGILHCGIVANKAWIVDVPMSRVKFNVNTEYAYIQNFKVLQSKFGTVQVCELEPY